jgi:hypothetical protein
VTRLAPAVVVAFLLGACGGPVVLDANGAVVIDESGEPIGGSGPVTVRGAPECGSDLVAIIEIDYPLGNLQPGESRMYVRDPDSVIPPIELEAPYDGRSSLSNDVRFTGYEVGPYTIWLGEDSDQYIYLVDGARVEAWPGVIDLECVGGP